MRVGIDGRILGSGIGGVDTYIRNIVRVLHSVDPETDYTLFLCPSQANLDVAETGGMRRVVVPPNALQIRIPFTLPLALARERIDVAFMHFLAPPICPARTVVLVHDISYERLPQCHPSAYVLQYRIMMPLVLRKAAAVVTVSEFSRNDIVRRYRLPPALVHVAPNAAGPLFQPVHEADRLEEIKRRYGTGDQFVLSVASLEPRKNLARLIQAYASLRRAGVHTHKLVLVGRKAWLYDDIGSAARGSGFEDDIVFTGYVPDADLPALYSAADLFVYPSLFEGFGLPPLEAMSCGTPVLCSNTSSLPEVVGNAAVLVDPLDTEKLAQEMACLLRDGERRSAMSRAGLVRAKRFSWEESARTIAGVYRAVGA